MDLQLDVALRHALEAEAAVGLERDVADMAPLELGADLEALLAVRQLSLAVLIDDVASDRKELSEAELEVSLARSEDERREKEGGTERLSRP